MPNRRDSTPQLMPTIGGHALKKISFTQFLTPAVLAGETQVASAEGSKYQSIRSKWTRELLEYRDELEQKQLAKEKHEALKRSMQEVAAKRLRQKQKSLAVPVLNPPEMVYSLQLPGQASSEGGSPHLSSALSPQPISCAPSSKAIEQIYPEASQKYRQLLALASAVETERRLEKARDMEFNKTVAAIEKDEQHLANIEKCRTDVQAQQTNRSNELKAHWAKRYGNAVQRRTQREQQALDQQLAEIERIRAEADYHCQRKVDNSPSQVYERVEKVRQRQQALLENEAEQKAEGLRRTEAMLQASEQKRQQDRELHRQWLLDLHDDWEQTCMTAERCRAEAVETIKEQQQRYHERVQGSHGDDEEDKAAQKRHKAMLERIPRVLEAAEELRKAEQQERVRAIHEKEERLQQRLQELSAERLARSLDMHQQLKERTLTTAYKRETQAEDLRERFDAELRKALLDAEKRRMQLLRAKVEDMHQKNDDFRRLEVLEAEAQASEKLKEKLLEKEEKRLEAKRELERDEEERIKEMGRKKTYTQRFEEVMQRYSTLERARIHHEEEVHRKKEAQVNNFRQMKEQQVAEKAAHRPAKDNKDLLHALEYLDLIENERLEKLKKLEEEKQEMERWQERRDAQIKSVAAHAAELRRVKEVTPEALAWAAEKRRLEYQEEVKQQLQAQQQMQEEARKKKEDRLTEVRKRRQLNEENYEQMRDARLQKLTEMEKAELERQQSLANKRQTEAEERARKAAELAQSQKEKLQRSLSQREGKASSTEATVEYRHSPTRRVANWFLKSSPDASPSSLHDGTIH